ncbi:MAG: HAMP domain-containing methyl-accepting chemotaxis protein [Acidobacteriota bacterium]
MTRFRFKLPAWVLEISVILAGLVLSTAYLTVVLPIASQFLEYYLISILVILVFARILGILYFRAKLLPPIREYKAARREGRPLGQDELERLYEHLAAFVPRSQRFGLIMWIMAVVLLVIVDQIWLVGTFLSSLAFVFTGAILATISLSMSYFIGKSRLRKLLEEVQSQLGKVPAVGRWRVSFRSKVVLSVLAMTILAFLAYGILFYARIGAAMESVALQEGHPHAVAAQNALKGSPPNQWQGVLKRFHSDLYNMAAVNRAGGVLAETGAHALNKRVGAWLKRVNAFRQRGEVWTPEGRVNLLPLGHEQWLVITATPMSLTKIRVGFLWISAIFFLLTLLVLGGYVWLLGGDMSNPLAKINAYSGRLASGDLREAVPIWSDDELGHVADNLRTSFDILRTMTSKVLQASAVVEEEVAKTVKVSRTLNQEVDRQSDFAEKTTHAAKALEDGMSRIGSSMGQIVGTTQDVSSTILEMQASVEEIAGNAETLMDTVEKTASSSNQIAASAQEVSEGSGQLLEAAQESVSFLTELDAALEETRRNAKALLDASQKVTSDAEDGFSAVAAVEDEILRSRLAGEESLKTLEVLNGSIERIGRIVDVIQDVTEQTNLLSLNASIIAAGAGEHGRSFAVVATQIRELSGRTANNAKEIRALIRSLTSGGEAMTDAIQNSFKVVENSADLSKQAAETLRTILESASSQEEMSKRIATATDELAHGGQSANRTMQRIFEMIESIRKATQEQVNSTQFLNGEAEKVRNVAYQLRNATQEQAKGARVITEAVSKITDDSQATTQSVQGQAKETAAIYEAMTELMEGARRLEKGFRDLSEAAGRLQQGTGSLNQDVRKFQL